MSVPVARRPRSVPDTDEMSGKRRGAVEGGDGLPELVPVDERGGRAILEDAADLRSREAEVDRHENGADLGRGKQSFHEFGTVMEQRGDAVAPPDAGAREGMGESAAARIQLSVGEPQVVERHLAR